ncbi:MAG TPA: hypothetical protein VMH61_00725, partial [Candidatus Acidoferrales bacterium]|nr:hypothetical protein [Candidatus Acidoferrales bacterium]
SAAALTHPNIATVYDVGEDAGRIFIALPLLRLSAATCMGNAMGMQAEHLRKKLLLGRVLEQKGDTAGACEQYGAILERWGNAKPKSTTADAARARSKALGCK